jgi:predicted RNA binding protein YcfA (HicA-like mRNA interferase family)
VGKLSNISGKQAVKAFERVGWTYSRQMGSHLSMIKPGSPINLTIPQHKELAPGTLRSLIRDADLTVDQFLDLL